MIADLLRRNRNFRLVVAASAVSNLGDGVTAVAFPWLASLLSRDALLVSLVATAGRLPWFLFALPAGVLTDRVDRRRLMVRADLIRLWLTLGVVALVLSLPPLPLADGAGQAPVLALAVIAFLLGTAEVLRDNAAQTVLPSIVAKADLERANGQIWSAEQVMGQFAGPPLAGALIAAGIAVPFGFDALTFAAASTLVWLMVLPPRVPVARQPFWPALREGMTWIVRHGFLLRLALLLGVVNAAYMAVLAILVLYAQEALGVGAVGYGLLLTSAAAGGVTGGLLAPRLAARLGLRGSLCIALVVFTLSHLALAFAPSPGVAGVAMFVEAFAGMLWNVVTVSYRQRNIPDEILGRVNAIYRFFGWGAMPFGAVAAGVMVNVVEPALGRELALRLPMLAAAAVVGLAALYAGVRLRPE